MRRAYYDSHGLPISFSWREITLAMYLRPASLEAAIADYDRTNMIYVAQHFPSSFDSSNPNLTSLIRVGWEGKNLAQNQNLIKPTIKRAVLGKRRAG